MLSLEDKISINTQLKHIPNVVGFYYGRKFTNGVDTGENSIVVQVTKKQKVKLEDSIPPTIGGIQTDVVEAIEKVFALTINPNYKTQYVSGCNESGPCTNCDPMDVCPQTCIEQRVHLNVEDAASENFQGRILLGGMSGLGQPAFSSDSCGSFSTPCGGTAGQCTMSIIVRDNVDDKIKILSNAHCVRGTYGYLRVNDVLGAPSSPDMDFYAEYGNFRAGAGDVISPWLSIEYNNPSAGDKCYDESQYRQVGTFNSVAISPMVSMPIMLPYFGLVVLDINGDPFFPGDSLPVYNMMCIAGEGCLTCDQREYINTLRETSSNPADWAYITQLASGNIYNRVPECLKADAALWDIYLYDNPPTNNYHIVPLPGIFDLGEGPFEWMTKSEFQMLFDTPMYNMYVYKSGARRGTATPSAYSAKVINDGEALLVSVGAGSCQTQAFIADAIRVMADPLGVPFGGGDSGSPVLIEHNGKLKVLGLLSWGGCSAGQYYMFVCPIWNIAEVMNITAWDGSIVVDSDDDFITVAGRTFQKLEPTTKQITHFKD